jgi:hypothetical protein
MENSVAEMGFKNWTRLRMQTGEVGSLKNLLTKCEIVRGAKYFSIPFLPEVPSLKLQLPWYIVSFTSFSVDSCVSM